MPTSAWAELPADQFGLHDLGVAQDDGEDVVEVVRHAAGKRTEGFELLGLPELLFALPQRLLGELAAADLTVEAVVRLGQVDGAFLQLRVAVLQRLDQLIVGIGKRGDFARRVRFIEPGIAINRACPTP